MEQRLEKLEREVDELKRLLEMHIRGHGSHLPSESPHPPKFPFRPDHPDLGPHKE